MLSASIAFRRHSNTPGLKVLLAVRAKKNYSTGGSWARTCDKGRAGRWVVARRKPRRDQVPGFALVNRRLHAAVHLLGRHVFDMGSDPPMVALRIFDSATAVTVELVRDFLQRLASGRDRALVHRVDVGDIKI